MLARNAEETSVEIRRLKDRLRVLSDATRAFAEATNDYRRLLDVVTRRLVEVIGDSCNIYLLSEDQEQLDAAAMCGHDEASTRLMRETLARAPLKLSEQAGIRRLMESGEAIVIPKFDPEQMRSSSSSTLVDYEKKIGIHSVLVMPLRLHKKSIGMLTMTRHRKESPSFDDDDRDLAQMLADHAALAIGNARAYSEARSMRVVAETAKGDARRAKTRFSRLEDAGILGIIVTDFDGAVVEVNETLAKIVGYSRAEIFSEAFEWSRLTPPEWKANDARAIEELRQHGVARLREKQYIRKDGTRVWAIAGSASIEGTSQVISFVLDITERKNAEADARRMREERAAETQFRDLVEAAPDASVIVDQDGFIQIVNAQTEALFGYAREELVGKQVDLLLPEECRPTTRPEKGMYFAHPKLRALGSQQEMHGFTKSGVTFPVEIKLGRVQTERGVLISAAIRDVSERKKLEAQRFALAAIVESAADAIIGTDLENIVTIWNGGAERLFGYAAEEVIGKDAFFLVPPHRDYEKPDMLRAARNGEVQHSDTVRRAKDGRDIDVSITRSPVHDAAGSLIGTSRWVRDVTEQRRAELALAKAKDEALLANRELEAFSYSVAHDLRAPLRGMNGFAQVLLDTYSEKLDADGRDWLEEIRQNARRMGELIDALLSLSRVTRSSLHREAVDLSASARATIARLAHGDPDRSVEIVVEPGLHVHADPALVRALMENLVGNAWKFTTKIASPKIEVGAIEKDGALSYFVRDNGAGFDMTFADKLFSPFQRLHAATEFAGTGIGLATVQRVVHRHGGRVWAEAKVGSGATFFFTLPSLPNGESR
jgi:PAS domain S-box-containing protein